MNRKDLLERIYQEGKKRGLKWSRAEVKTLFEAFLETMEKALLAKENVGLPGLGTFVVRKGEPRKGYDFQTRRVIEVPERYRVVFRASRKLKELLRD